MSDNIAVRLATALENLLASPNSGAMQEEARAALDAYRGPAANTQRPMRP